MYAIGAINDDITTFISTLQTFKKMTAVCFSYFLFLPSQKSGIPFFCNFRPPKEDIDRNHTHQVFVIVDLGCNMFSSESSNSSTNLPSY